MHARPETMLQCARALLGAMTPAGLEPAIPSSVGRCLIHWATGPVHQFAQEHKVARHVRRLALLKASSCRSRDLCSLARTPPPLSPRFRRLSSRQSSQAGSQGISPRSCVSDRCALQTGSGHDPGRTRTYNPRLRRPMPYPLGHGATERTPQDF